MLRRTIRIPPQWLGLLFVLVAASLAMACLKRAFHYDGLGWYRYFPRQAWSFLHGHLDLIGANQNAHDLTPIGGKVYAYWPPLTALLMLPGVAASGLEHFHQRCFAIAFGVANTAFYYLLCDRFGRCCERPISEPRKIVLALAFGLGSSNLVFAVDARHWYVGQLTASTMLSWSLWAALDREVYRRRRSAIVSACALALAMLGREHLVLAAPLLAYLAASDERYRLSGAAALWRERATLAWMALPLAAAIVALGWYNHARFGSWLDTGMAHQHQAARFLADVARYGCFHPHYVLHNVYSTLLRLPGFWRFDGDDRFEGFSLFVQSPILILALWGRVPVAQRPLAGALWISAGLIAAPIAMLEGSGWVQFGARYLYDFVPLLVLIALLKHERVGTRLLALLAVASIAINVYGIHFLDLTGHR